MPEETIETPQPTQPAESKFTSWPRVILSAVLGFSLLAASAYAGYWYGAQQVQPTTEPTPIVSQPTQILTPTPTQPLTDPTIGWKTYTNTEYGYSAKYPQEWDIEETNYTGYLHTMRIFQKSNSLNEINFCVWPDNSRPCSEIKCKGVEPERFLIYGIEAFRFNVPGAHNSAQDSICLEKDNKRYDFQIFPGSLSNRDPPWKEQDDEAIKILNQILSTFKFLD